MNELVRVMSALQTRQGKALIPFLMAGDPDEATTAALLDVLAANGADVLELGIPHSDPLADGPVLQGAASRALAGGVTPAAVFELVSRFRRKSSIPVVLLVYYNMVLRPGLDTFCTQARAAGVSGLVVPDLPLEEAQSLEKAAKSAGLVNVRFIAPTTTPERLEKICQDAQGFIYAVTVAGVTGERSELAAHVAPMVQRARKYTTTPIVLGFGISGAQQASAAVKIADGCIVGSALAQRLEEAGTLTEKKETAAAWLLGLKKAMKGDGEPCRFPV
jgi:tryptophan synthase alpha chain